MPSTIDYWTTIIAAAAITLVVTIIIFPAIAEVVK